MVCYPVRMPIKLKTLLYMLKVLKIFFSYTIFSAHLKFQFIMEENGGLEYVDIVYCFFSE